MFCLTIIRLLLNLKHKELYSRGIRNLKEAAESIILSRLAHTYEYEYTTVYSYESLIIATLITTRYFLSELRTCTCTNFVLRSLVVDNLLHSFQTTRRLSGGNGPDNFTSFCSIGRIHLYLSQDENAVVFVVPFNLIAGLEQPIKTGLARWRCLM